MKFLFASDRNAKERAINESGIATFTENRIGSLTREILQNSLDARIDDQGTAIVTISKIMCSHEQIPDYDGLLEAEKKCKEYFKDLKKDNEFHTHALSQLEKDPIPVLCIRDYKTTGLTDSDTNQRGKNYYNLIWCDGASDKPDDAGGSFGIGKKAPFSNSFIRTVFYSSLDIKNIKASIGVAELSTFEKADKSKTFGTGYCLKADGTKSNPELLNYFGFEDRAEPGTDIAILGFTGDDNWKEDAIISVLINFTLSIYLNYLEITIEDTKITKKNLDTILVDYFKKYPDNDDLKNMLTYYALFKKANSNKEEKTYIFDVPTDEFLRGLKVNYTNKEMKLYLQGGEFLNQRILVIRKNGMRILEQTGLGKLPFTGILYIFGKQANSDFRTMENPKHTRFSTDNIELPEKKERLKKIYHHYLRYLKDAIQKQFGTVTSKEVDAFHLSEFLPAAKDDSVGENEGLKNEIKDVHIVESHPKKHTPPAKIDDDGEVVVVPKPDKPVNPSPNPAPGPNPLKPTLEKVKMVTGNARIIKLDQSGNYRIKIIPNKKTDNLQVKLRYVGESLDEEITVKNCTCSNGDIRIDNDSLVISFPKKVTSTIIDFTTATNNTFTMGVELYAK